MIGILAAFIFVAGSANAASPPQETAIVQKVEVVGPVRVVAPAVPPKEVVKFDNRRACVTPYPSIEVAAVCASFAQASTGFSSTVFTVIGLIITAVIGVFSVCASLKSTQLAAAALEGSRAWVFDDLPVGEIEMDVDRGDFNIAKTTFRWSFRNYGVTPAINLVAVLRYYDSKNGVPDENNTIKGRVELVAFAKESNASLGHEFYVHEANRLEIQPEAFIKLTIEYSTVFMPEARHVVERKFRIRFYNDGEHYPKIELFEVQDRDHAAPSGRAISQFRINPWPMWSIKRTAKSPAR